MAGSILLHRRCVHELCVGKWLAASGSRWARWHDRHGTIGMAEVRVWDGCEVSLRRYCGLVVMTRRSICVGGAYVRQRRGNACWAGRRGCCCRWCEERNRGSVRLTGGGGGLGGGRKGGGQGGDYYTVHTINHQQPRREQQHRRSAYLPRIRPSIANTINAPSSSAKLTRCIEKGPLTNCLPDTPAADCNRQPARAPAPTKRRTSPPMPLPTKLSGSIHHRSTNTTTHPLSAQRRLDTLTNHLTPTNNTTIMSSEPV
jgi:hypothetical protein